MLANKVIKFPFFKEYLQKILLLNKMEASATLEKNR